MIRVVMALELSWQRNDGITYFTSTGNIFFKIVHESFIILQSPLLRRSQSLSEIYESVLEILWDKARMNARPCVEDGQQKG